MVKFDAELLKYLTPSHYRVLVAIEMGMKNHDLVPTELIENIAGIKNGCYKVIQKLHKYKLIYHDSKPYDGYRLKFSGYDMLAVHTFLKRGHLIGIGRVIGCGKESDVFEVMGPTGDMLILKLHRLGRTSFRKIKEKRDYHRHRKSASWLYLSRISALTEYSYMKVLHENDFLIPLPVDHNRHAVLMARAPGLPMNQIRAINNPNLVYVQCMDFIARLAEYGLIHCDLNEFNLMVDKKGIVTLIDFPQMVSTSHAHAEELFDRDVNCIITFFKRRFGYSSKVRPILGEMEAHTRLDEQVEASGFKGNFMEDTLENRNKDYNEEKQVSFEKINEDKEEEEKIITTKEKNQNKIIENTEEEEEEVTEQFITASRNNKVFDEDEEDEEENKEDEEGKEEEDEEKEDYRARKNTFRQKKRKKKEKKELNPAEIQRRLRKEKQQKTWRKNMKGSRKNATAKKSKRTATQTIKESI